MVPILPLSEKLNAGRISTLALFGSELESSTGSRATNITLEGWEPFLPGVEKMTLIMPNGGLEEASLEPLTLIGLLTRWTDTKTVITFPF